MNVLALSMSLRAGSLNRSLLLRAAALLRAHGADAQAPEFRDFAPPLYDGDLEHVSGLPVQAQALHDRVVTADAVVFALPEYNFSMSGVFKNTVDWLSRARPVCLAHKPVLLLSASPSEVGGNRGLWAARVPLEAMQAHVFPDMFSLSKAHERFTSEGALNDAKLEERLNLLLSRFLQFSKRLGA